MKKFSVIIPAYNEEKYIEKTLISVKNQSYKDVEIIVVCNGCTDNTRKISLNYADKILQINERNVSKARNIGADRANGEILIFLDADTLLGRDILKSISESIETRNVFGTCKLKPEDNEVNHVLYVYVKNIFNDYLRWSSGLIFCRRDGFYSVGGFDENKKTKGEIRDFLKKLSKVSRYRCVNSSFVITSQRRIKKWGIVSSGLYWIKEIIKSSKEEYPAIR